MLISTVFFLDEYLSFGIKKTNFSYTDSIENHSKISEYIKKEEVLHSGLTEFNDSNVDIIIIMNVEEEVGNESSSSSLFVSTAGETCLYGYDGTNPMDRYSGAYEYNVVCPVGSFVCKYKMCIEGACPRYSEFQCCDQNGLLESSYAFGKKNIYQYVTSCFNANSIDSGFFQYYNILGSGLGGNGIKPYGTDVWSFQAGNIGSVQSCLGSEQIVGFHGWYGDCIDDSVIYCRKTCKCAPGLYNKKDGVCAECSVGKFSAAGASTCQVCSPGSYSAVPGSSACIVCEVGKTSGPGATYCYSIGSLTSFFQPGISETCKWMYQNNKGCLCWNSLVVWNENNGPNPLTSNLLPQHCLSLCDLKDYNPPPAPGGSSYIGVTSPLLAWKKSQPSVCSQCYQPIASSSTIPENCALTSSPVVQQCFAYNACSGVGCFRNQWGASALCHQCNAGYYSLPPSFTSCNACPIGKYSSSQGVLDIQEANNPVYSVQPVWKSEISCKLPQLDAMGAWCSSSSSNNVNSWIMIDLTEAKQVRGIVSQGDGLLGMNWVTRYRILYSNSTLDASFVVSGEFDGNEDGFTKKTSFVSPFSARFVRFVPISIFPEGGELKLRWNVLVSLHPCSICPAGTFSTKNGMSTCHMCQAGTYSSAVGATTNSVCSFCSPGSYSSVSGMTGSSGCTVCSKGTYSQTFGASTAAVCQHCQIGKYSTEKGAVTSDACLTCTNQCIAPGQYSTCGNGTAGNCSRCQNVQLAGTSFFLVTGITRYASLCQVKNTSKGFYRNGTNPIAPMQIFYMTFKSVSPDFGSLCMFQGNKNSQPYYLCNMLDFTPFFVWWQGTQWMGSAVLGDLNKAVIGPGVDGGGGTYLFGEDQPVITLYSDLLDNSVAWEIPCSSGAYASSDGSTACILASAGYYVSSSGSSSQTPCAANLFSYVGASACTTSCPAGTYKAASGSQCLPTTPGSYSIAGVSIPCPRGTFSSMVRTTSCTNCIAGTYSSGTGMDFSVGCTLCTQGSYTASAALSDCTVCGSGRYNTAAGSTLCLVCTATCPAGKQLEGICTTTSDALCRVCTLVANCIYVAGTPCGNSTHPNCLCMPGFELVNGLCQQCKRGFFQKNNSLLPCTPWNTTLACPAGSFLTNGTRFTDTACVPLCPAPPENATARGVIGCEWRCKAGYNNTKFK